MSSSALINISIVNPTTLLITQIAKEGSQTRGTVGVTKEGIIAYLLEKLRELSRVEQSAIE